MSEQTCAYDGCHRPVYQNPNFPQTNKCIFHCDEKDAQEFYSELQKYVNEPTSRAAYDFSEWSFPQIRFGIHLRGRSLFRKTIFFGDMDFGGIEFNGEADFTSAVFKGVVLFKETRFKGVSTFKSAQFSKTPDFTSCHFHANADFSRAQFPEGANFSNATFWSVAVFKGAEFSGTMMMHNASFAGLAEFTSSVIRGRVVLQWPGPGRKLHPNGTGATRGTLLLNDLHFEAGADGAQPILDFRDNFLQDDCLVVIAETRMSDVLLLNTDCRRIVFQHVYWLKPKGRHIAGDENLHFRLEADEGEEAKFWSLLDTTYQQLTSRYRADLNHPVANDFEQGIFEARLQGHKVIGYRRGAWLLRLYKWTSNFGGSISRPVYWVFGLTVSCAFFYGAILYGGSFAWPLKWQLTLLEDSLVTAFRVISLDRGHLTHELDAYAVGLGGKLLASIIALLQTALTATLVTLFIFAIRRRFKHSE